MITHLLRDAADRPDLFQWTEAIDAHALGAWAAKRDLHLHPDLVELLKRTGGGDLFETETLLRPFGGTSVGDNADEANEFHRKRGLPRDCWLFHSGIVLSAVRQPEGLLVVLSDDYRVSATFRTLDEWYLEVLRSEYGERYGLPPFPSTS